jgi:hypothetical protein
MRNEADRSCPSIAEVMNTSNYATTPYTASWSGIYLNKHGVMLIFIFIALLLKCVVIRRFNCLNYSTLFVGKCLCGLVVRVLGYRSGGPGSIPSTTRKKVVGLERVPLSLVSTTEELPDRKEEAPV